MNEFCQACGYAKDLHVPEGHEFVPDAQEVTELERDLARVLNKHSAENGSNTPDFILAEYLMGCLKAYNTATKSCRAYQGVEYLNAGTKDS